MGDISMKKSLVLTMAVLLAGTTVAQADVRELIDVVKRGDMTAVRQMIAAGENVNAQNEQGNTALHYAVATDNAEMTRILLNSGADLNAANEKGWTPLKIAQKKNVQNVTEVLNEMAEKAAQKNAEVQTIAAERKLLQRAAAAVESARESEKNALAAQEEAEKKALILQSKVAMLEKTLAEKSKALDDAEKKMADNKKSAANKVAPVTKKPVPKTQPKKPAAKPQPKPQPVVKIRVPQPSKFHANMTDGADEVIYCLNLLGQGENQHMARAAGYYAAANGVNEARYNQIVSYSAEFYNSADDGALKQRVEACGKVITPADATEQNRVIRALNEAMKTRPDTLIAIDKQPM